ncbi:AAA family ATPase [Colwellia hornerae]|uniref:AAA family ATPase n=1 Tax=Colwellia hornerae TaxID=89402 RepID=A0A5C6Q2I1_9GAMM|nr:AAA family ATPase [Colwellia hornerae]TWX46356.1 AAA family ATPase [Colwellia hornerae]TWX53921.1 AAA family ATPase [Colwellia hornerae]TWX63044.1 AAA family ATPase [Colwellia hornerae]
MNSTNTSKENKAQFPELHIDITKLSFIKNYHPIVIRHAFSNNRKLNLDTCVAFLNDKSVIQYLLLSGISGALNLKNKYKGIVSLATPASTTLEVSKLKKALKKSKKTLLSQGEELAKSTNCKNATSIESLLKYGRNNLIDVLPSIDDEIIADALDENVNQKLLFDCLPDSRVKKIKHLCKASKKSERTKSSALAKMAYELKQFLLKPTSYGVDPFTFDLLSYQTRIIDSIDLYSERTLKKAFSQIKVDVLINALKVLEPFEQYKLLKNCEITKASYAFEQYKYSSKFSEYHFKSLNKVIRKIRSTSPEMHESEHQESSIKILRNADTFDEINNFNEKIWRQLLSELSLKQIYCATCKARSHESLSSFMLFLEKQNIQISYEKLDQQLDIYSDEVLEFQDEIIVECKRIKLMYNDIEHKALEAEIMLFHGIVDSKEIVDIEPTEQLDQLNQNKHSNETIEVYCHEDLMTEIILGLKDHDAKVFQQIQEKGNMKKLLYVPHDYKDRLNKLAKNFPNFTQVIEFLMGCLTESFITNLPLDLPVINFDGCPGIGKSQFSIEFASLFGLDFNTMPVTSMGDKFELIGAHKTWNNASIGSFSKILLLKNDSFQPFVLIDELCMVKSIGERNLVPTLLSLFESEQSQSVTENFLGFNVNFSGFIIFTTTNDIDNLVPALRSRIISFSIQKPTIEQMKTIGANIYTKYRVEKKLGKFLTDTIPTHCHQFFINQPPRLAKQLIIAAIRKAIQRVDIKLNQPLSIEPSDFQVLDNLNITNPIGFVH